MKRLILSILALSMLIGFSGCAKKIVKPDIVEVEQIKTEKDMSSHKIYNGKHFQLLAAFEDTIDNSTKINDIMTIMKEKINNKQKSFKNNPKRYTHDEQLEICKKRVFIGKYGRYRNSIERDDLLRYCMDEIFHERKNYYTGITSNAEINNGSLLITSKVGNHESSYVTTWQTLKTLKMNKKIYLVVRLSKNTYADELIFIDTNLLNIIGAKKIITIQPPIEVDFSEFSKLL